MGRPVAENPKNKLLQVRLDNDTYDKLEDCAKIKNANKSEIVRQGINLVYDDIKKWVDRPLAKVNYQPNQNHKAHKGTLGIFNIP